MMRELLRVENISKSYEGKPLLHGISFTLREGETLGLLGASGSGKSTLLRIIAGLEEAEGGTVYWKDQDLTAVPAHKRGFGLMFQDYALFPHRNVAENVAFGLRMQGLADREIRQRVEESLAQVGMQGFAGRRVTDLSGGEQQRVALARALAPRPRLLLLDEPLGALDHRLRTQLLGELRQLLHESAVPAIYVTHDQEEAFTLGDQLILLHEGKIHQQGVPAEVFLQPASLWAARFLGLRNFLPGVMRFTPHARLETAWVSVPLTKGAEGVLSDGQAVTALVRGLSLSKPNPENRGETYGVVTDSLFQAGRYQITVELKGDPPLNLEVEMENYWNPGSPVGVDFRSCTLQLYDQEGRRCA